VAEVHHDGDVCDLRIRQHRARRPHRGDRRHGRARSRAALRARAGRARWRIARFDLPTCGDVVECSTSREYPRS
jgi:hypothetical protein